MQAAFLLAAALLGAAARPAAPPRPVGTVRGVLRHKNCPSAPAGATVSVLGRDARAPADAEGRFELALPPGTWSLVIGGPGLVPDQRVDDVTVDAGQTHDLGVVEVWPGERPAGCVPGALAPPPPGAVVATAPDTPAVDLPGASVSAAAAGAEQVWVRAGGGSGAGHFGLHGSPAREDEDALGPPAFAVGPGGALAVLDAMNGRVVRFDARGAPAGAFPVPANGGEPVVEADLALADDGHLFLFTASEPPVLSEHDPSGRALATAVVPPSIRGVDQLLLVRQRPAFLLQNGQVVRAELGWGGVRPEGPLPGIPTAGGLFARAERLDRWRAVLKLLTSDGRVRRSVQLHSRVPVSGVRLVGAARRGEVVLAVDRAEPGDEGTPRAEVLLLAVDPLGHLAGVASVPPGGRRFEFREFALAPDGAVVQMQSDVAEVRFVRWQLRPPAAGPATGEGLVRGRVLDGDHGGAHASVTVLRPRRQVPVASDGTFEVRLPAGTYVVSVRRPAGGDPQPVELRVAVAPGATVDLGDVSVARAPRSVPVPPLPFPAKPMPLPDRGAARDPARDPGAGGPAADAMPDGGAAPPPRLEPAL